ncbi:MAG: sulfatase [Puniceicoccaceae bacterium]
MKHIIIILLVAFSLSFLNAAPRKNILLIMADDFNYWNGINGYYPQAKTPNVDALARKGVLFNNAHSPSPVCNPSRNAMWSGVSPMVSGIDTNAGLVFIREVEGFEDTVTLNQYFKDQGYYVYGGGKLWHPGSMKKDEPKVDPEHWTEINEVRTGSRGGSTHKYQSEVRDLMAWSAGPKLSEDTSGDYKLTMDVVRFLQNYKKKAKDDQPFFIGCGLFRPHLPWNSPIEFWEKFDRKDISIPAGWHDKDMVNATKDFAEIVQKKKWQEGIHAYLAASALADHNVGVLMDALEKSPYRDNTIVLFMGDHGWQLGEKARFGKYATWEAANHTTLIIYDPSAEDNGKICEKVVNLQDIYPTLIELTSSPEKKDLSGDSLAPLLDDVDDPDWTRPMVFQYVGTRYIQVGKKWRFIENKDESELYDIENDPYEHINLYGNPEYKSTVGKLRKAMANYIARDAARFE